MPFYKTRLEIIHINACIRLVGRKSKGGTMERGVQIWKSHNRDLNNKIHGYISFLCRKSSDRKRMLGSWRSGHRTYFRAGNAICLYGFLKFSLVSKIFVSIKKREKRNSVSFFTVYVPYWVFLFFFSCFQNSSHITFYDKFLHRTRFWMEYRS